MSEGNVKKSILTVERFRELARPTSVHLDTEEVTAYIRECEDAIIIPAIGYNNFKAATIGETWDSTFDETFNDSICLDGGEWTRKDGTLAYCHGLRKALAYYVYAKMLRADGAILSRAGAMRHRDGYSEHVEETKQYKDVMLLADAYMANSMEYYKIHLKKNIDLLQTKRGKITAIGD